MASGGGGAQPPQGGSDATFYVRHHEPLQPTTQTGSDLQTTRPADHIPVPVTGGSGSAASASARGSHGIAGLIRHAPERAALSTSVSNAASKHLPPGVPDNVQRFVALNRGVNDKHFRGRTDLSFHLPSTTDYQPFLGAYKRLQEVHEVDPRAAIVFHHYAETGRDDRLYTETIAPTNPYGSRIAESAESPESRTRCMELVLGAPHLPAAFFADLLNLLGFKHWEEATYQNGVVRFPAGVGTVQGKEFELPGPKHPRLEKAKESVMHFFGKS